MMIIGFYLLVSTMILLLTGIFGVYQLSPLLAIFVVPTGIWGYFAVIRLAYLFTNLTKMTKK